MNSYRVCLSAASVVIVLQTPVPEPGSLLLLGSGVIVPARLTTKNR
ncbi:MAG: hypothetical protein DMG14_03720 [Acidobacteria bacterium]|nr:MAG: hypothetical protein DMG14_03720 [Acidobacteriota bacterium]